MERVKRRWWTRAVSLLAAVVILGAVISGMFQLAVLALPSYRADLSAWITRVANRPVQIGGVNLGWRGVEPRLDLNDITLFSEDGNESLTVDRLSLGFSLLRLVTGDVFPDRLEVGGLSLVVELDAEGHWHIAGFSPGERKLSADSRKAWSRDLERFRHLRLRNCTIALSGPRFGPEPQELRVALLEVDQNTRGFEIDGKLLLPVTHGASVTLSADVDGKLADPDGWRGEFEVDFTRLRPQGWLAGWLQPDVQIGAENFNAAIEGRVEAGQIRQAELAIDSGALLVARGGKSSGARKARLRAALRTEASGWALDLGELRFDDEPLARGSLHWRPGAASQELDVNAEELRIGRLTPWLAVWRELPPAMSQAARLSGTLRNFVLRLRTADGTAPRYSATARVEQLALAEDQRVGFAQLSGEVSANENGGELRVTDVPLQLQLPSLLGQMVAFDAVRGQAKWKRTAEGWRLSSDDFGWKLAGTEGGGRLDLDFFADGERTPLLDLQARFSGQNIDAVKPFMPVRWSENLRNWLQRSLLRGRVTRGELVIHGPVLDFPFHKHPTGNWRLDLDTAGVDLAFSPDWPQLDGVAARLRFAGNSLKIDAQSARVGGSKLDGGSARIDDFGEGMLEIDAKASGGIAGFYDYLNKTPLRTRLSALLQQTRASGDAQLDLQLRLPLHDLKSTDARGSVVLDDVQLFYGRLEQPIDAITGQIFFNLQGISGERISARFDDLPLAVRIVPRSGTHGVINAEFPFTPNADGSGVSRYIPALLRKTMSGESRWHAELPLQERDAALMLSSDLRGTALKLPEPLDKSAETIAPISLRIGSDADAPMRIGIAYAQRIGLDLAFAGGVPEPETERPAPLQLKGIHARFGTAPPPKAIGGRFIVDGRADTLDISDWIAVASGGANPSEVGGAAMPPLGSIDLEAAHLRWNHQLTGPTRLRYQPTASGWRIDLAGDGAKGSLDWSGPAPGRLVARLDHVVAMPKAPPGEAASAAGGDAAALKAANSEPPMNPKRWPKFDVNVERLSGNGSDLGRVQLRTVRVPYGQRIEKLAVGGGIVDFNATGQWRRDARASTADLRYQLKSRDFEAVLKALDYAPSLSAKEAESNGELKWLPSPSGLAWQAATGRVNIAADDGQLRALKPGATRVLGLINFYALPRRLTLNFRDVVDEGLGFDQIRGRFELGNGAAVTDDLSIDAPSLRMEMRGRIGLAARDYDQRVTVFPGLSSGVTIGAALLGGPAVGALVLLAQEILDKPLDQVTQLTYHVTGSWDNPKVERVESRSTRPAEAGKAEKTDKPKQSRRK